MGVVTEIESRQHFETSLLEAETDKLVVVDFYAYWCLPCRIIAPTVNQLATEKDITVLRVNVDTNVELADRYDVITVPTFLFFRDGEKLDYQLAGNFPRALYKAVKKYRSRRRRAFCCTGDND